jgi:hypothetical protein
MLIKVTTLPFVIPELTCLQQVKREMTMKIATDARPGGPPAKREPSPVGLGSFVEDDLSAGGAALNLGSSHFCHPERTPDFLPRCSQKRPQMRLSFEESRMMFTETTKSDRKSGGSLGICSSTPPATTLLAVPTSHGARSFDGPDHCFRLVYRLFILFFRHRIGYDAATRLNVALLSFEKHAADGDAGVEIS